MYTHTFLSHKYYKIGDIYMIRKMPLFSLLWPRPHVAGIFFSFRIQKFPRPQALQTNQAYSFDRHIALLFGTRLGTTLLRHTEKSEFTVHTLSGFVEDSFFHSRGRNKKIPRFAAEFAGCVWTEAVSRKKKWEFKKYPDTCGAGLSHTLSSHHPD